MRLFSRCRVFVLFLSLTGVTLASDLTITSRTDSTNLDDSASDPIQKLIAQLGSDDYTQRREAEARLIQLGAAAFDYLENAQNHPDLEIATQSQYLLHSVPVDWTRDSDSDEVRRLMTSYGGANGRDRRRIISELSDLESFTPVAALGRIAHYELSPKIAKQATLTVLGNYAEHRRSAEEVASIIRREVGHSPRESAEWLRLYAGQLTNANSVDRAWHELIGKELALLTDDPASTSITIVLGLLQFNIGLCQELSDSRSVFEALQLKIDFLNGKQPDSDINTALVFSRLFDKRKTQLTDVSYRRGLRYLDDDVLLIYLIGRTNADNNRALALAMAWIVEQRQWDVMPHLENKYADALKNDRLLLYLSAIARSARSEPQQADEVALRAFELVAFDLEDRNRLGDVLAEFGHHVWAEREWRHVIDKAPVTSTDSLIARRSLANWCLHDRGEDKEAARLLAEVCEAFDKSDQANPLNNADEANRPYLKILRTQRDYFMACHMESQQDYTSQRRYLDAANRRDPEDPDVLIAMYRLKNVDDAYRQRVEGRISRAVTSVEQQIKSDRDNPTPYNHYAWLVSNTRGDFEKAIRYSHKSLELRPNTPSYLDTLGRCYYAAGDYENAVKYQRRAVEMHPEVQVMRRQLEQFEKALAEKNK